MKHFMTLSTCIKLLGLTMMIQCGSASSAEVVSTDLWIFISGGIGLDERQEMYANRDRYNLRLSLAKAMAFPQISRQIMMSKLKWRITNAAIEICP
jgi:hypothetical protein